MAAWLPSQVITGPILYALQYSQVLQGALDTPFKRLPANQFILATKQLVGGLVSSDSGRIVPLQALEKALVEAEDRALDWYTAIVGASLNAEDLLSNGDLTTLEDDLQRIAAKKESALKEIEDLRKRASAAMGGYSKAEERVISEYFRSVGREMKPALTAAGSPFASNALYN